MITPVVVVVLSMQVELGRGAVGEEPACRSPSTSG